jgi:hypothetical protein
MAQKRYFEVVTVQTASDERVTSYVEAHSPKSFLGNALAPFEKAQAGRTYTLPNGAFLTYKPMSREAFNVAVEAQREADRKQNETEIAECWGEYEKAYPHLNPEPDAMSEHSEAEQVVAKATAAEYRLDVEKEIRLRLSVNDDMHLTGETIFDDDVITSLGFDYFLDRVSYDNFVEVANKCGYSVSVPADSIYRFMTATPASAGEIAEIKIEGESFLVAVPAQTEPEPQSLPEGARVSVEAPRSFAAFNVPKLSKRQQRRQAGALFCVQRSRR